MGLDGERVGKLCAFLFLMSRIKTIRERIEKKLSPIRMRVDDETGFHISHPAMAESILPQETHLKIYVASDKFNGVGRLERNRAVNELIMDEFDAGLHAVTITCDSGDEYREKMERNRA